MIKERALPELEERKPVEEWAKEHSHTWEFAAAKAFHRWPDGYLLTREEYLAAFQKVNTLSFTYPPRRR